MTIKKETYIRNAKVVRVIDGDTVVLDVDLGCSVFVNMTSRLDGINAPEKNTPEGVISKKWLEDILPTGSSVIVQTVKDKKEKYGRYLAVVFNDKQKLSINDTMVVNKLATPYHGENRDNSVVNAV